MCEAEGIDATAEMFDDVIDTGAMQEKVRYYAGYLAGDEPDQASFERMVSQLGGYYTRRSAYSNTTRNCEKNDVRYARVPGGGETCAFCMMLAGRGFVYHSEALAYGRHGVHAHCDCVVMPGRKGRTAIEGYDPDVCERLAERFEEIDDAEGLTVSQKKAIRLSWYMALIGEDTTGLKANPTDIIEAFDDALRQVQSAFHKDKTQANYDSTVSSFLGSVAEPFGVDMTGGTYVKKNDREIVGACPNGEELWAALRWSQGSGARTITWVPTSCENKMPDFVADCVGYEIKTPRSLRKIPTLAADASKKKFDLCGAEDESKNAIFSLVRLGDASGKDVEDTLGRFVEDGALDSASIVTI